MSEKHEHQIDVMVMQGADGTVHVRTPENMEDGFVDEQFNGITEGLGSVAMADVELPEPAVETNTDADSRQNGKNSRRSSSFPERPSKVKK